MSLINLRVPLSRYNSPSEVIASKGAIFALKGLQGVKVATIVSGSLYQDQPKLDKIKRSINCHELRIIEKKWKGEPSLESLTETLKEIEDFKPDIFIAIGGGAVIDGTKILWMLYEHPSLKAEQLKRPFAIPKLKGKAKFIAIPTTIGSGSESSSAAVLYDSREKTKFSVVTHDFLPDLVILDPELLDTLPKSIYLSTLCDSLSHSIEGYVSKINNPIMETLAEKALSLASLNWEHALNGDLDSLLRMQTSSMYSGIVQNHCVVGVTHSIAHQLMSFGISHSVANALLLTSGIKFNSKNTETKKLYDRLALNSGLKDINSIIALIDTINSQRAKHSNLIEEKNSLRLAYEDSMTIENALQDQTAKFNPVQLDEKSIKSVLEAAID